MEDMSAKCVNCGELFGRHHCRTNACPLHRSGTLPEQWAPVTRFQAEDESLARMKAHTDTVAQGEVGVVKLNTGLPTDAATRKNIPVYTGFIAYFPRAIAAVAELSRIANEQHHPGSAVHWDKSKSTDEKDSLMRHMLDEAMGVPVDTDKVLHATKRAWRAMADLERTLEKQGHDN